MFPPNISSWMTTARSEAKHGSALPASCYDAPMARKMYQQQQQRTGGMPMLVDAMAGWRHNVTNPLTQNVANVQSAPVGAYAAHESNGLLKFGLHFVGGTFGGMGGIALSYPLDTVKVRMQTSVGVYKGMVDCMSKIATQEGMKTFYRGVAAPLSAYGVIKATTFGVYGNCLDYFAKRAGNPNHTPTYMEIIIAGHLSGFAAAFIMAPSDRVKVTIQSMQGQAGAPTSTLATYKYILKNHGIASLFRGFTATALRDGPGMALYYIVYDAAKKTIPGWSSELGPEGKRLHTPFQMLIFGGASGVASWLPVYPIDVLKSRIQASTNPNQYKGLLDCAVQSVKAEGPMVLYRGCLPVLLAAIPLHGTVFMVYEMWMKATRHLVE